MIAELTCIDRYFAPHRSSLASVPLATGAKVGCNEPFPGKNGRQYKHDVQPVLRCFIDIERLN